MMSTTAQNVFWIYLKGKDEHEVVRARALIKPPDKAKVESGVVDLGGLPPARAFCAAAILR